MTATEQFVAELIVLLGLVGLGVLVLVAIAGLFALWAWLVGARPR